MTIYTDVPNGIRRVDCILVLLLVVVLVRPTANNVMVMVESASGVGGNYIVVSSHSLSSHVSRIIAYQYAVAGTDS